MRSPANSKAGQHVVRTLAVLVWVALLAFVILMGISMHWYPGGNWVEKHAMARHPQDPRFTFSSGHHFLLNYLCDLTQPVALNGQPNVRGMYAGQAGMALLSVVFLPFWWLFPSLFPSHKRSRTMVRVLGTLSSIALVFVPFAPSSRVGHFHDVAIFMAAVPGLAAALVGIRGLFAEKRNVHGVRWMTGFAMTAAMTLMVCYVYNLVQKDVLDGSLPAIQKIVGILALAWVAVVAGYAWRGDLQKEQTNR